METPNSWTNENLLKYIHASNDDFKQTSIGDAISGAEAGLTNGQIKILVVSINAKYNRLGAIVKQHYQSDTTKANDRFDTDSQADEKEGGMAKIKEAKKTKQSAEADQRQVTNKYDWGNYWWKILLEGISFFAEVSYNAIALSGLGGILALAILPSVAVSIGLCAISLKIPPYLRKIENPIEAKRAKQRIALQMGCVFVAMATLRSIATIGGGSWAFSCSGLIAGAIYVVINGVIFTGSVIISGSLPTEEDRVAKRKYDILAKKIKDADRVIGANEKSIQSTGTESNKNRKERINVVGQEAYLLELINSMRIETLTDFYRQYTMRNTNGNNEDLLNNLLFNS
jgi:hypothetical protein